MRNLVTIFALWAAGLGAAAQFAKLAVGFGALDAAYPEAGKLLGFAVSFLSLSGLLLGLVAGSVVARRGAKQVLVGALVLGALLSAFEAFLPPLPLFLATRVAEGLSHLGLVVAAPTLIAELAPDRWRAAAMTLWSTFFGVAFALLAWIAPGIIASHGLGALIGGHAVYMGAMALILVLLLPAPRPDPKAGRVTVNPLHLYSDARLSAPAWGWLFYTLTFVALLTLLPQVMGPQMPAWLPSALPLASIVASLSLGVVLLRRLPAIPVTVGAFAASALVAMVVLATGGAPLPTVALFLCLGIVQAGSFASIPELNPALRERALANGAVAQMGNLGNLAGTPLLLMLIAAAGPRAALAAIAGCYVAGATAHAILARARRS